MTAYIFLGLAIVGEVVATTALKASNGFSQLAPSIVTVVGYAVTFYFLSLALKTIPVGIAYGMWAGLGIVLISAVSWVLFGQKLDVWGFVGLGFILAGVVIVNVLSKSGAH